MPDRFLGRRLIAAARLARWERLIETAVGGALARRADHAAKSVGTMTAAIGDWFGLDEWDTDIGDEVEPVIRGVLEEVAAATVGMFPLDAATLERVLGRIDVAGQLENMLRLIGGIGPDIAGRLNAALAEGVGLGESVAELGARVSGVFDVAAARAATIARTETARAANATANAAAGAVNDEVPIVKTWLATEDDRTRETHADADGQTVAFDDVFDVGGWPAAYPCDPELPAEESVNCRCVCVFDAADGNDAAAEQVAEAAEAEAEAA